MKKNIYISAVCLLSLLVFNTNAQSVTWDVIKDDPFDTKNFTFAIDPFFVEVNGHNNAKKNGAGYAFGWGMRAEHMMGKVLLMNFDTRFAFGTNGYRKSNENTRNYFNMEGGVGLIFSNRTRRRNVPIILSQSTSGNTRTTVSIRGGVPANVRKIVALRAGFQQYTNTLGYESKGLADSLLTFSAAGTTATFKQASTGTTSAVFTYTETAPTGTTAITLPMEKLGGIAITSLYAGFQFRTIRNLIIDVSGYGIRSNIIYSDFYIDFMFAPIVAIKDFKNNDGTKYEVRYEKKTPFGWRLGWFLRKPKDQGFSQKFEIGSRPGFKAPAGGNIPINGKNLYMMYTLGLYIPLKIKPIYMGE